LRGVKLEDADRIIEGLIARNMSSYQVRGGGPREAPPEGQGQKWGLGKGKQPPPPAPRRRRAARPTPSLPRRPAQAGMDSVRNLTGSPIAGLDPHELLDVR
jgi:sulfite reductase beta subunit-like hemoprotein